MVGHPEVILRPSVRTRSCPGELRQPFPMQIGNEQFQVFTNGSVNTTHYKRAPFGGDFDRRSLRSDGRQGARPAARRSARASLRVLDCVLASASVLSSGSWRSPFLDCARFRFYEFPVVLEVMPAEKNRSASLVARNFWAMREGRPFGVGLIVCIFTYRKEHPYE